MEAQSNWARRHFHLLLLLLSAAFGKHHMRILFVMAFFFLFSFGVVAVVAARAHDKYSDVTEQTILFLCAASSRVIRIHGLYVLAVNKYIARMVT